ncbi:MAG: DsbE family thiol:disulfide interchange protein [Caulobacterales bacterium]
MRRLLAVLPIAVLLVLAGVFAFSSLRHDPKVIPRAMVGRPAPSETLPILGAAGSAPVLPPGRSGPVLVNFFASWCAPCAEESPELMALKAEGVTVIGVAYEDDPQKTQDFLTRFGNPYASVHVDRAGRAGIDYGVSGVPETYLVSADGKILEKQATPLRPGDAEALLAKGSTPGAR